MNKITTKKLHIEKVTTSSIHEVDFTNLVFGKPLQITCLSVTTKTVHGKHQQ